VMVQWSLGWRGCSELLQIITNYVYCRLHDVELVLAVHDVCVIQSCRGPDNNLLEKITEVTGIVDHRLIQKAIADCSDPKGVFQIDDVVNRLLGYDVNPASPSLVRKLF